MKTLHFHPHMTLTAAARIAAEHGRRLDIAWHENGGLRVISKPLEPPPIPEFLLKRAPAHRRSR